MFAGRLPFDPQKADNRASPNARAPPAGPRKAPSQGCLQVLTRQTTVAAFEAARIVPRAYWRIFPSFKSATERTELAPLPATFDGSVSRRTVSHLFAISQPCNREGEATLR